MEIKEINSFSGEYRPLSNFWPVKINLNGIIFSTVEHAYQASKTTNISIREEISFLSSPAKAKNFWNETENTHPTHNWKIIRLTIMEKLISQKFSFDNEVMLIRFLTDTKNNKLVEGNDWGDIFWGMVKDEKMIWQGENNLGKILMDHRKRLILLGEKLLDYSKKNLEWPEESINFGLTPNDFFKAKMVFGIK